jgi:hypothetical protein
MAKKYRQCRTSSGDILIFNSRTVHPPMASASLCQNRNAPSFSSFLRCPLRLHRFCRSSIPRRHL